MVNCVSSRFHRIKHQIRWKLKGLYMHFNNTHEPLSEQPHHIFICLLTPGERRRRFIRSEVVLLCIQMCERLCFPLDYIYTIISLPCPSRALCALPGECMVCGVVRGMTRNNYLRQMADGLVWANLKAIIKYVLAVYCINIVFLAT